MVIDLERRGGQDDGERPIVTDGQLRVLVNALGRYGIGTVLHSEDANPNDAVLSVADSLRALQPSDEDEKTLSIVSVPTYEQVIEQAHQANAAAIVPTPLATQLQRNHRMGQLAFVPFTKKQDNVSVLAPLHVIAPRDFEPVTAVAPGFGAQ